MSDGFPIPKEIRKLSMGDFLRVYEQSLVIESAAIFLNRKVEQKDIEAIVTIYTTGMAARSRMINAAWSTFMEAITSVKIVGYSEKEKQQWAKEEEDG